MLINTETCKIPEWPKFDVQTRKFFQSRFGQTYPCHKTELDSTIQIQRVNLTWIQIDFLPSSNHNSTDTYECYAREIKRSAKRDRMTYGSHVIGKANIYENFLKLHVLECSKLGQQMTIIYYVIFEYALPPKRSCGICQVLDAHQLVYIKIKAPSVGQV